MAESQNHSEAARCRRMGQAAFSRALEDSDAGVRRYVRGQLKNTDAIDDVMQETFIRMLRYRNIDDPDEIRALMYRVAGNVVADVYRRAKSHAAATHVSLHEAELPGSNLTPERVASSQQDLARIKQAIRELPPRYRQVFLLHRFEGLSYREIAQRLGTSPRTVENQIAHALGVCRRALGENREGAFR